MDNKAGAREYFIALVFLLGVFLTPVMTLAGKLMPGENDGLFAAESTAVAVTPIQKLKASADDLNAHHFMKKELIMLNRGVVKLSSGGTYLASTQVLAGKDHWLFFKSKTDGQSIEDYMGTNLYDADKLLQLKGNFAKLQGILAERGIPLYAICVPDKEIVCEGYMPDNIVRLYTPSRGEQLTAYINDNTTVPMMYPREALQAELARGGEVYYSTDTHWNHRGAFIGLQQFFAMAYGDEPRSVDSVRFLLPQEDYAGDLATIAGVENEYAQDRRYTFDISSADPSQYHDQCLMIIGDSFMDYFSAIAGPYYREVYYVGEKAYDHTLLDKYKPDLVIWESGERRLSAYEQ